MSLALHLTPKARADLDHIWAHTVLTWDEKQAEVYLLSLDQTMRLIADHPGIGTKIDTIRTGYRKFPAASHLLIYRLNAEAIEIVRILHKSMDVELNV